MTPEVLADQNDVCGKVVTYFSTLYSDDPVVLRRIPLKKDWHPGSPTLTLESWIRFKARAVDQAKPSLSDESARTPAVDRYLAMLTTLIGEDGNYAKKRDDHYPEVFDPKAKEDPRQKPEYIKYLKDTSTAAEGLIDALRGWKPLTGAPEDDEKTKWSENASHDGMVDISVSLVAQAQVLLGEVSYDLKLHEEQKKLREETIKALTSMGGDSLKDGSGEPTGKKKKKEKLSN